MSGSRRVKLEELEARENAERNMLHASVQHFTREQLHLND